LMGVVLFLCTHFTSRFQIESQGQIEVTCRSGAANRVNCQRPRDLQGLQAFSRLCSAFWYWASDPPNWQKHQYAVGDPSGDLGLAPEINTALPVEGDRSAEVVPRFIKPGNRNA